MTHRFFLAHLACGLLFAFATVPSSAHAELTTDPATQHRVDLRLERLEIDGANLGIGAHVGRLRVRLPVGNHSLEATVPWARFSVDSDFDENSNWGLGNISVGFGLHHPSQPLRLALHLGLPTASDGPISIFDLEGQALLYGLLADFVPSLESYLFQLDHFLRLESEWKAQIAESDFSAVGQLAVVGFQIDGGDFDQDLQASVGVLHELRGEMLLGAELLLRHAMSRDVEDATETDLAFEVGRRAGEWQVTGRLRVPLDEERRDEGMLVFSLMVAFLPNY